MISLIAYIVVPVVLYMIIRIVPPVVDRAVGTIEGARRDAELEERLSRMEAAIDAMAVQLERLRASEAHRYVGAGREPVPDAYPPRDR